MYIENNVLEHPQHGSTVSGLKSIANAESSKIILCEFWNFQILFYVNFSEQILNTFFLSELD